MLRIWKIYNYSEAHYKKSILLNSLNLLKIVLFILKFIYRPKSGSMLLYSRKKVRYRRDGYCWKKRKDGKTTREDHMKLKVQGTEVIQFLLFFTTRFFFCCCQEIFITINCIEIIVHICVFRESYHIISFVDDIALW